MANNYIPLEIKGYTVPTRNLPSRCLLRCLYRREDESRLNLGGAAIFICGKHSRGWDRILLTCAFCVKWVLRMVLNKVLELFCVKKKDSKKKVAAPHPTANVSTNNSLLDPFSSGNGTVLSVQKHEPECSSVISSMTRTEYGFESDGCNSFSHFDVQDFSDHYYAKNSPGKLDACAHPFFDELREPNAHLPWQMVVHSLLCSTSSMNHFSKDSVPEKYNYVNYLAMEKCVLLLLVLRKDCKEKHPNVKQDLWN
uniref:Uncharacterized protein n=1 Tax=Oryza nivara TaxID=4536 RepID=A0A0E0FJ03_ORYNI